MSRSLTAVKVGAVALALVASNLSAQEARVRLPANAADARAAGLVEISTRPYAGSWTGTFSLIEAPRNIPMTVNLSAIEGSLDTYSGETQVARSAAFANAPISTLKATSAVAVQRTANGAMAATSGPNTTGEAGAPRALPSIEVLNLTGSTATMAMRGDRAMMCDSTGRCGVIPAAKWGSKGFNGADWIYTATLVEKDKIEGTITVMDGEDEKPVATFSLTRSN